MGKTTLIKRWEIIGLVIILCLGAYFRLYKISEYQTFLGDEGRDALVMRDITLGRHLPLIGPGTSIGNMYLGPLYYYLTAPSLALAGFSPVGPAVEVAVFGLVTIALLWWLGRQWFHPVAALIISLLYAISPTVIIYSRSSWNPNIMPFFALLCLYSIWLVWTKSAWPWLLVCAVSFAFVLNSHYLGLLLLPTLGIFWLLSFRRSLSRPKALRLSALSLLAFLLLMSPLVFFDLRHHGQNFSAIKTFFTDRQTTVNFKFYKALPQLWPVTNDFVSSMLTAKLASVAPYMTVFLFVMAIFLLLRHRSRQLVFLLVWLSFGLLGLGLYKQHIYDHYYGFLYPAVFLLLGFAVNFLLSHRRIAWLVLPFIAYLIVINIQSSPLRFPPNNQLAHTRAVAAFIINRSAGQPFNLALLAKSNYDASYRYFLDLNSAPVKTIHQQITHQLFVVCEQPDCRPIGNPLWEIASFGWAKIDTSWSFPWGVTLYRLVPNPSGV